jgi:AraC-like DNA-binding protein
MKGLALIAQIKMPLDSHPAFRATRYDELEAAVASRLAAAFIALPEPPATVDARANMLELPHSRLWFCSYGIPIAIRFPEPDHLRIQFHHSGTGATWIGDALIPITPDQACVSSTEAEFDFARDFQQVVWRVSKDFIRQKLASLTDSPLQGEIAFDQKLDLSRPRAQLLSHLVGCTVTAADSMSGIPAKVVLAELEQALVSAFLSASSHTHSDRLDGKPQGAAPWQVRRAEGYIAANWDKPLTIEALAEETGASVRSIFRAFKQSRGYTPFEFAKRVRLAQARRMLEDAEASHSVTNVAFACGFGDLGRFSKDFAQAFGERPSEVLKRRKADAAFH